MRKKRVGDGEWQLHYGGKIYALSNPKYIGTVKRFAIKPVVVFANNFPVLRNLSEDRCNRQIIGQGMLSDLSSSAIVSSADEFPFAEPPSLSDLRKKFLCENIWRKI